jgi:hypothetical protein
MIFPRILFSFALALLAVASSTQAQTVRCRVEPFQGATLSKGALAYMRVVNTGDPCGLVNFGLPSERTNPAESGNITKQPVHGKAEFIPPEAKYVPTLGFVGEDEFEFEAYARGRSNQQVRLKVQVKVTVIAP